MILSLRNRILAFLILSLTLPPGRALAADAQVPRSEEFFQPYAGFVPAEDLPDDFHARIRSIRFDRRDAFDGSIAHSGTERKLFAFGNKLHIVSREGTIRRRLLFKEGEEADKRILTETEKALRSEEFLSDAIVEARLLDDSACDIRVTTYDQWTTIPGASAQALGLQASDILHGRLGRIVDGEWIWWAGISESNLLGTGTKVGAAYRHDLLRDTREVTFKNSNISPQKLQVTAYAADRSDGDSLLFKIEKPLLASADRYAYGISLASLETSERVYFDADRLSTLPPDLTEEKAGRSHVLQLFNRVGTQQIDASATASFGYGLKFDLGPTFDFQDHYGRGEYGAADTALLQSQPLPNSARAPEARTDALLGVAMSLYRYTYRSAHNLHNLKWNESYATGWRLNTKAAVNQRWLGAGNPDYRFTQEAFYGDAWSDQAYWSAGVSWQAFLTPSGGWEDGQTDAWWEGQWKPHPFIATVLTTAWSHLIGAPQSRQLLLGEDNGLSGFPSFYYAGQARFLATAEQRFFPAFEFLTLVPSFAAMLSAGNTYPSYRAFDPAMLHYSAGLGLRLGRTKSTQKVVNHLDICWPLGEDHLSGPVISILARKNL